MSTIHDDSTGAPAGATDEQPAQAPPPTMTFARGLMSVGMAVIFLALLAAAAAGMWYWQTRPQRGPAVQVKTDKPVKDPNAVDRPRITSFQLTDQQGQPFDSKSMKGKIWVVNFFFASCPSTCRQLSGQVQQLVAEYAPKGVQFVSITVDPDRDTTEVLAEYAELFNARSDQWRFLRGDKKLTETIGADLFNVATGKVTHTDMIHIVGPDGKPAGDYNALDGVDLLLARGTLNNLLKEQRRQEIERAKQPSTSENPPAADAPVDAEPANGDSKTSPAEES